LKDVVAGLSEALAKEGVPTAVVLPRYGFIDLQRLDAESTGVHFDLQLPSGSASLPSSKERVEVFRCRHQGAAVYLLDCPRTRSKRAIYTYTGEEEKEDRGNERDRGIGTPTIST